jgi:hypothetical protein
MGSAGSLYSGAAFGGVWAAEGEALNSMANNMAAIARGFEVIPSPQGLNDSATISLAGAVAMLPASDRALERELE